jgi:hypothetical protein
VAVITVLVTQRNQRLGDLAAGTLVLRERTGARAPSAATFAIPPGWEAYAATLDVSGLTAGDYQAVREFLLRASSLDPWTRDRLARAIATPLLAKLRHSPPQGIPVDGFLVCVAALWQQRQRGMWGAPPAFGSQAQQASGPPRPMPAEWRPGESAWQGDVTPTRPDQGSAPGSTVTEEGFIAPG